jgi:DNA polymerase III gamma/tau subunit
MPLHTDHRPNDFSEIIGNSSILKSLESIFTRNTDYPHAYLFHGESGCGKTTLARIVASKLGCARPKEINTSDDRGIETARNIIKECKFKSINGENRVYILDEVHSTTATFQNALLKPLEDPPTHAYFVLCTTDPDKLLKTVRNRCEIFGVRKLSHRELVTLIREIIEKESASDYIDKGVIEHIAEQAQGCPRQALVILDQIIDMEEADMIKAIKSINMEEKEIKDLCKALIDRKPWKTVSKTIEELKDIEPEKTRRAIIGYISKVIMGRTDNQIELIYECFKEPFFDTGMPGLIFACYQSVVSRD